MMKHIIILVAMVATLASCTPKVITQIEYRDSIKTEFKTKIDTFKLNQIDTIKIKNDTVIYRSKTVLKDVIKQRVDTVYITKTDVQKTKEVIKLSPIKKFLAMIGGISILCFLFVIIIVIIGRFKRIL